MKIYPILLSSSITIDTIDKFSCLVGIICIFMIIINIWFSKELILHTKKEIKKVKILLYMLYIMIIIFVSVVLSFLALKCFII